MNEYEFLQTIRRLNKTEPQGWSSRNKTALFNDVYGKFFFV